MRRRRGLALVAVTTALVALHAPPADAKAWSVGIRDNYFTTPFRIVTVGDSITWTNNGSSAHTVVAYDGSFDSSPLTTDGSCDAGILGEVRDCLGPDDSFTVTFDEPGTYAYYCKVTGHADISEEPDGGLDARSQPCGMCGQVRVNKKPTNPPPGSRTPDPPDPDPTSTPTKKPSKSPSPTPTPTASGTAISTIPAGESGPGSRLGLAFAAIVALGGVGYYTWRRFIAPS